MKGRFYMKDNDLERIHRMKIYCTKIGESIARYGESLDIFSNDWDYHNSVSMSIMQIGELTNGLSEEFKNATRSQIPWGPIRAMRNHFAHGYATMSDEEIWETATQDIPNLLSFCQRVIEKSEPELRKAPKRDDR